MVMAPIQEEFSSDNLHGEKNVAGVSRTKGVACATASITNKISHDHRVACASVAPAKWKAES